MFLVGTLVSKASEHPYADEAQRVFFHSFAFNTAVEKTVAAVIASPWARARLAIPDTYAGAMYVDMQGSHC